MARLSQEARLLALTCVLLSSQIGLTRPEIFRAVPGYDDESIATIRKFERDKGTLRDLGLALETLGDATDPDNLQEARYRVSKASFEWPEGFKISKRQLQYLELAAKTWSAGEMSRAANFALTRLKALGLGAVQEISALVSPRLVANDPAFAVLTSLISEQRAATFRYRKPDGNDSQRQVSPWLIRSIGGQFVLLALDHSDSTVKNFLIRRIIGRVEYSSEPFRAGSAADFRAAELSLTEYILENVATLRVHPNSEAWVHFGIESTSAQREGDPVEIELHFMDAELLVEELIEYGGSVEVVSPETLQGLLIARAKRVVDLHA